MEINDVQNVPNAPNPNPLPPPGYGPRSPWLAGLLSLIAPGLGHFYIGNPWRGIRPVVAYVLIYPTVLVLGCLMESWTLCLLGLLVFGSIFFQLGLLVDAAILAHRAGKEYKLGKINKSWVYGLYLVGLYTLLGLTSSTSRRFIEEAYQVPAGSMMPTLTPGDHFVALKMGAANTRPRRGDVVVFIEPESNRETYVKRLIGLPGDQIELRDNVVYVNGNPVPRREVGEKDVQGEEYVYHVTEFEEVLDGKRYRVYHDGPSQTIQSPNFGPIEVPEGQFFVLGDNRNRSKDSRWLGSIPFSNYRGRACVIFWSSIAGKGIQKDRIGSRL